MAKGVSTQQGVTLESVLSGESSDEQLRAFLGQPSGITNNIVVNGAIDSESTARQIVDLLNESNQRGTLGGAGILV